MKNEKKLKPENKSEIGFEVSHKAQLRELPAQIIKAPKEATDPAEMIKHA